jgi:TrmH family RNA methyltransferase
VNGPDVQRRFDEAQRDPSLVVLEGFHAIKHAIRFDANLVEIVCLDTTAARNMASALAPDIASRLEDRLEAVTAKDFERLARDPTDTEMIAIARRPIGSLEDLLNSPKVSPIVFLDRPSSHWNIGASIRVAAAAGAAGVLTTGIHDPWHPSAVRAATGLQFALPVIRTDALQVGNRPLVAIDPDGDPSQPLEVPDRAVLAFGSERAGLSEEVLRRSDLRIAIPMEHGVSSLNVATAVAVVLYAARLSGA